VRLSDPLYREDGQPDTFCAECSASNNPELWSRIVPEGMIYVGRAEPGCQMLGKCACRPGEALYVNPKLDFPETHFCEACFVAYDRHGKWFRTIPTDVSEVASGVPVIRSTVKKVRYTSFAPSVTCIVAVSSLHGDIVIFLFVSI